MNRALATLLGIALLSTNPLGPTASADPAIMPDDEGEAHSESISETEVFTYIGGPGPQAETAGAPDTPISQACGQFAGALNLAALNYEEFAYATAGNGDEVDYQDQNVMRSNVIGRTALREAAYTALGASRTPGLPPEVSDPMRAWSLGATKLLIVMGLRRGGDSLNSNAAELNSHAHDAQMACAANGANAF